MSIYFSFMEEIDKQNHESKSKVEIESSKSGDSENSDKDLWRKKINLQDLLLSFEKYWSPYSLSDGSLYKEEVRNLIPENKPKNELNIKVVFETLKRIPQYSECAKNLYAYYKYFSQYEHFSESGFGDAIADFSNDNVNFEMALVRLEESITVIQEGLKNNE